MTDKAKSASAGWRRVRFGDVVRLSKARSRDPLADGLERYVGLEHLEPGDLQIRTWGNVAEGTTFTSRFEPGQVLFGKRRAYQRKIAVADFAGVCSGDIYVLESKDPSVLLPELLPFICQTDAFFEHAIGTSAGSLSPRTNWSSIAEFSFSLPSIEVQKGICSIALAREGLNQELRMASFRCSALKRSLRDHLFSADASLLSGVERHRFPIPRGWKIMSLPSIASEKYGIVDGPFGSNLKSEHYRPDGIPVIQSAFVAKGWFDEKAAPLVFVDQEKYESEKRSSVGPGDIVMVKIGINCGACTRLPLDHRIGILAGNCLKITVNSEICDAQFLLHYLHWLRERRVLDGMVHSTQQRALSLASVKSLSIGIPAMGRQKAIAAVLDECGAALDALELRSRTLRETFGNVADRLGSEHVQ